MEKQNNNFTTLPIKNYMKPEETITTTPVNNNFIEEVEKEFDSFMINEYGQWKIGRVEAKQFISQKLQECQELAYENERKIRRNEKCKTAEINYKAGREELKKEIVEIVNLDLTKEENRYIKGYREYLIDKIKNI